GRSAESGSGSRSVHCCSSRAGGEIISGGRAARGVTHPRCEGALTAPPDDRDRLVRSSAAVAMGTLLSRVTGLLRVAVLAYAVGRASLADTYNLANSTPNIVYELLLGGVLSATLVPLFVEHLQRRDEHATAAVFTVAL